MKKLGDICLRFICLCGLRDNRERIAELYRRLNMLMQESTTYQGIIEESEKSGELKGVRKIMLIQGTVRFGPPSDKFLTRLNSSSNIDQLELLAEKLLTCSSWEDLFTGD